jgi:hypothetical protein
MRSCGINAFGVPGRCGKDNRDPSCSNMAQEAGSWMLYLQVTQVPAPSTLVHKLIQQLKASEYHVQYTYVNLVLLTPAAMGPPFVVISERVAQSEREAQ